MDTKSILTDLRSERDRLDQAIAALEALGATAPAKRGRKPATTPTMPKKRTMSATGRKRIAAAQRARWAAKRAAEKKAAAKTPVAKKAAPKKRVVSAESRKKMAEAQRKRWAKKKRAAKSGVKKTAAPVTTAAAQEASKT